MGRDITITCDTCQQNLTSTGNCVDYRLVVQAENIPTRGGAVTAMMIYPPVEREYIFCNLGCLRKHPIATGDPTKAAA